MVQFLTVDGVGPIRWFGIPASMDYNGRFFEVRSSKQAMCSCVEVGNCGVGRSVRFRFL